MHLGQGLEQYFIKPTAPSRFSAVHFLPDTVVLQPMNVN
jgi:hypothetical protein